MLNVRYTGFGGYMEVPCYEDEKGKLYFDENNGVGGLNLYTGAYRNEDGEILGEPDTKVTESVECAEPFVRHPRERDYRMLGRLKSDCEYFLKFGAGNENVLYYKNVEEHCNAMEKLWNSFEAEDKPEWLTMEQIQEYRDKMTRELKENGLATSVNNLSEALSETNRMLARTDNTVKNVTDSVTLQQSKEMMSAALGSTDELLSLYKDNNSRTVAQAVNVVAEERAEYNNKLTVKQAIENRQHTHYGAYADIGTALDKFSTDELIDYLRKNEPGGEGSLRGYVESQIIGAQINRERYQSENNFVTESVTNDMPDEPDIEQAAGLRM